MEFSKKKFLEIADKHEKRIFARFLDEMEGKEVDFGGKYGILSFAHSHDRCVF